MGPVEVAELPEGERRFPAWIAIGAVFLLLSGAIAWLLFGAGGGEAFVYSKMVDEVVADPGAFAGRELRVEGELQQGSIRFREDPCEWRFVIQQSERQMSVRFPQCVVPDTFRDGMGISVVVQGRVQEDGSFVANQVVPRCPSKYEMEQRQQNGEEVPHEMTTPRPPSEVDPDPPPA